MKLIGLAGTNGAGKDLVGEILEKNHNYMFVSVTELLRTECTKRGLPVERQNLRAISSEWRKQGGLGVLVDKALEMFKETTESYQGLVMTSMRNEGEADRIHEYGGTMLWIDADPHVRYNRIFSRQRSPEDAKTYEEFLAEGELEMYGTPGDPTSLNAIVVKQKCDLTILNEGDNIAQFEIAVAAALHPLALV